MFMINKSVRHKVEGRLVHLIESRHVTLVELQQQQQQLLHVALQLGRQSKSQLHYGKDSVVIAAHYSPFIPKISCKSDVCICYHTRLRPLQSWRALAVLELRSNCPPSIRKYSSPQKKIQQLLHIILSRSDSLTCGS